MWFRELVGFEETTAHSVRAQLEVDGEQMRSLVNGREMGCGTLDISSVAELRTRTAGLVSAMGQSELSCVVGDAGALHRDPVNRGATFQVASQFNLLEMVSPEVGPEHGVSGYENDLTQGPACAVACGAGTIYRNYFVEVGGKIGQSRESQVDCLAGIGRSLFPDGSVPWTMTNGYAMFDRSALDEVNERLGSMDEAELDAVKAQLRVGVHADVEVTSSSSQHRVTQVYCSALPVGYHNHPTRSFEPLARLVLDAAYEATLLAAALNASRTGNRTAFLTLVGGGVFENPKSWIVDAIDRAFRIVTDAGLNVAIVSYGELDPAVVELARRL